MSNEDHLRIEPGSEDFEILPNRPKAPSQVPHLPRCQRQENLSQYLPVFLLTLKKKLSEHSQLLVSPLHHYLLQSSIKLSSPPTPRVFHPGTLSSTRPAKATICVQPKVGTLEIAERPLGTSENLTSSAESNVFCRAGDPPAGAQSF